MSSTLKRTYTEEIIETGDENRSLFQPFQKKLRLHEDDVEDIKTTDIAIGDTRMEAESENDDEISQSGRGVIRSRGSPNFVQEVEDDDEQPSHLHIDEPEMVSKLGETIGSATASDNESDDDEEYQEGTTKLSTSKESHRDDYPYEETISSSSSDNECEDDAETHKKEPSQPTRYDLEKRSTNDEDEFDSSSEDEEVAVNPAYEKMSEAMDTFLSNSKTFTTHQANGSERCLRLVLLDDRRPPSDPRHRIEFHLEKEYDVYECNRFNFKTFSDELSQTGHCFSIDMTGTYMVPLAFDIDCLKKDHETGRCVHDRDAQRVKKSSQRFVEETTSLLVKMCKIKNSPPIGYVVTSNSRTCGFHVYFDCFVSVFLFDMLYKDVKTISGLYDLNIDKPTSLGLPFYIKVNAKTVNEDLASFKHTLVSSNNAELSPFVYCANNLMPEIVAGTSEEIMRDKDKKPIQTHVCGILKSRNRQSVCTSSFYDEDVIEEENNSPSLLSSAFWDVNLQHKNDSKEFVIAVLIDAKNVPIVKNVQLNDAVSKNVVLVLDRLSFLRSKFNKPPIYEPALNNQCGERFVTRFVQSTSKENGGHSTRNTTNRRELGMTRLQYLMKRERIRKETTSFVANIDKKIVVVPTADCPTVCLYVFDTLAAVGTDLGSFLYTSKTCNKFENILHIFAFMMEGGAEYVMLLILSLLVMRCTEMDPNYIKEVYCVILVTLCDFYIGEDKEESELYEFNKDEKSIVESLRLIRHCASAIQDNDCTSGMLSIAKNKDHLKIWLTDAINNVMILQDHKSMSDFFAYEFSKELSQEEFEALVEQFLRINLRVLYTARCCYVYRVELGIYTACSQDRYDFKKDHLVKKSVSQLVKLSAGNKSFTKSVIQQLVNAYMENLVPCEIEFNNYPMHICTEQGVFNTITGCYSPHSSFMFFTTCKSYCLTTRTIGCDIVQRPSSDGDSRKKKGTILGGVSPIESEYDRYGLVEVNGHLFKADQVNARLVNEEIPLYSSLFRVLIEDTCEIRMKCMVIPSLVILNESVKQYAGDLNRMSTVVANFVMTNDSLDDVDRLMHITVLINMYHFDVRHTIVPAYKAVYRAVQENQEEMSLARITTCSPDFMGMSKSSKKEFRVEPPSDQLDMFGFLSELEYEWKFTENCVNTYEDELENCNRFVERFEIELKRSKKNVIFKVDKSVLVLTYLFVILDYCRREDARSYFYGIIGHHDKELKWFMNRSLLEQVGSVTSPYGKIVSTLVSSRSGDTQTYMFNVTESVLRVLITRKDERIVQENLYLDKYLVYLVHNLLNTFLFDKHLLTDVFISLSSMYSPMSERKKFILLQGPSHSGKSVIVTILTEMNKRSYFALDREVSSRSDSNSATPATLQLYSKYFVSVAELCEIHPGFLKVFTGNDRVHKRMLQSNEYTSDINIAMMVGACDQTLSIATGKKDDSNTIGEEVRNRLVVLPMSLQFKSKPSKCRETVLSAFSRGRVLPLYFTMNQEARIYSPFLSNLIYTAFLYDLKNNGGRVREMKLISKQAIACSMEVMAKTSVVYRIMLSNKIIFKRRAKLSFEDLNINITEYALQNSTVEGDDANYESKGWAGLSKKTKNEIRKYMKCFKDTFPNMVDENNRRFVGIGYEKDNATQSTSLSLNMSRNPDSVAAMEVDTTSSPENNQMISMMPDAEPGPSTSCTRGRTSLQPPPPQEGPADAGEDNVGSSGCDEFIDNI